MESTKQVTGVRSRSGFQFIRYALTYFIVLVMPIAAFLTFFGLRLTNTLRDQLNRQLQTDTQEVAVALSHELEQLIETAVLIDQSNEFLTFKLGDSMDLVVAHAYLRRIDSVNEFVVDVAYVPEETDRIFTVNGPLFPAVYYNYLAEDDPDRASEVASRIETLGSPALFTTGDTPSMGKTLFAVGIPIHSPVRVGTVVFEINRSYLDRLLASGLPMAGKSAITLVEAMGPPGAAPGIEVYGLGNTLDPTSESVASFRHSVADVPLAVRLSVERDLAYGEIKRTWLTLVVVTLVVLVSSVPLIYLFAFSNRSPLHRLFSFLQRTFKDEEISGNVIDFAENRIERLVVDLNQKSDEIHEAESFVRRELLVHIVNGSVDNWGEVRKQCDRYGIDLDFGFARVLVITPGSRRHESEVSQLIARLRHLLQRVGEVYGFMDLRDGDFVLVVTDASKIIEPPLLEEFKQLLSHDYGIEWNVSVSSSIAHYLDVPRGYLEAKSTQEHRFVLGFNRVLFADQVLNRERGRAVYPASMIDRLYNFARNRNLIEIQREISRMFQDIQMENLSLFSARSVTYHVITALIFGLSERSNRPSKVLNYGGVINLSAIRTFPEMEQLLLQVSSDLVKLEAGAERGPYVCSSSFDLVVDYVSSRCFENSLVAKEVADRFGMSLSNFSHQFKRRTARTFRQYVEEIRIRKAKQLLSETSLTVNDIVQSVGFNHANSFIKSFKRAVGLTPTEYRRHQFAAVQSSQLRPVQSTNDDGERGDRVLG